MPTLSQQFEEALADSPAAEQLADTLQPLVQEGVRALPNGVADFLRGEALGHPLHPALVHLPLGGWMVAGVLDLFGGKEGERAADTALLLATVGAVPSVAAGWTDWSSLRGQPRRTGVVHGLMEESAFVLNAASLLARKKGKRGLGKMLSGTALALALAGGILGGELVYGHRVGVS